MTPTTLAAEVNRKHAATEFLRLVACGEASRAYRLYAAPDFRHHNPYFRGDAQSLLKAMDENAAQHPDKKLEVKRVLQDGDLVAVHGHVRHTPDERGFALVHIFRFSGDRIAELWDIAQEVPADSPNEFGMF